MYVCKTCGTFSTDAGECCGTERIPLDEAIGTQEKLFDLEGNDRARHVLHRLKGIYEATCGAVSKAEDKLESKIAQREAAGAVLIDFYNLTVQSEASDAVFAGTETEWAIEVDKSVKPLLEEVVDEINAGALDGDGVTVTVELVGTTPAPKDHVQSEADGDCEERTDTDCANEPCTGCQVYAPSPIEHLAEVIEVEVCPACEGDGRPFAKDGSRNGNAKCKTCGGTGEKQPESSEADAVTAEADAPAQRGSTLAASEASMILKHAITAGTYTYERSLAGGIQHQLAIINGDRMVLTIRSLGREAAEADAKMIGVVAGVVFSEPKYSEIAKGWVFKAAVAPGGDAA